MEFSGESSIETTHITGKKLLNAVHVVLYNKMD